jgi:hypothetical protein
MATDYEKWIKWYIRILNQNPQTIALVIKKMTWPTFHEMRKELGLGKSKKQAIKDTFRNKHIDECMARMGGHLQ